MLKLFRAAVIDPSLQPVVTVITDDGPLPKAGLEHAFDRDATLCGIKAEHLIVMRRNWSPRTKPSCSACRAIFETSFAPGGVPEDYPSGH